MLATKRRAAALTTAQRNKYQTQFYNQPVLLSTILAPLKEKFHQKRIQGLLGEIIFLLLCPHFTTDECETGWVCFEILLRRYLDLKYKGVRRG